MKTCPQCSAPVAESALSCARCGARWNGCATLETSTIGAETLADALGTRYQVTAKLGSGAFGEVYRARDTVLDRDVAIKRIRLDALAEESRVDEVKARFLREAQVAAQLKHPNIVTIHDIVSTPTTSFIVMELIEGGTLHSVLQARKQLSLSETIDILAQAADALDHAHGKGVIHRDVKPANIMIETSGQVKVTDFGIAKAESSGNITATGSILGTPNYMSPEQARGKDLDGRSDLFSLGCVLYECLSGVKPFRGENVTAVLIQILNADPPPIDCEKTGLPPAVRGVMNRALAKDPRSRFLSGAELMRALRSLPSTDLQAPTVDIGMTHRSPQPAVGTRRHSGPESTLPAPPSSVDDKKRTEQVTIRRAPPRRDDKSKSLWWWGAALLLIVAFAGTWWWTERREVNEAERPPRQPATADAIDARVPAEADEVETPPPRPEPPSTERTAGKVSPPEPSPPPEPDRDRGSPSMEPDGSGEARPSTEVLAPSEAAIRANERAVVEVLVRISRMQARAKSELGRYMTAQQFAQRRRALFGSTPGVQMRGNQWLAHGYRFNLGVPKPDSFVAIAVPAVYGKSGIHSFYIDATGVLRAADKSGSRASASDPPLQSKPRRD